MDRLEEIKNTRKRFVIGWAIDAQILSSWDWLIAEVERLQKEKETGLVTFCDSDEVMVGPGQSSYAIPKQEAVDYQRRHRGWALKKARSWLGMIDVLQAEIDLRINDAKKAEVEVERLRDVREALIVSGHEQLQRAEKAEAEFAQEGKRIKLLNHIIEWFLKCDCTCNNCNSALGILRGIEGETDADARG
jgi:hypothetical protein